jgi:uncharacterized membrane protein
MKKKKKVENKSYAAVLWMSEKSTLLESILIGIILIGMLLNYLTIPKSNILIIIGFASLAVLYYFLGYAEPKENNLSAIEKVILVARGSSTSVCLLGILFSLQKWIGNGNLLGVGAISLSLVLGTMIYFHLKNRTSKDFSIDNLLKSGLILIVTAARLLN